MRAAWTPKDGSFVPCTLTGPHGTISLPGMVDTGAEDVLLDGPRLRLLGLVPVGRASLDTAGGADEEATYEAEMSVAGKPLGKLAIVALAPSAQASLVVGRSALRFFRLSFDGPAGILELL